MFIKTWNFSRMFSQSGLLSARGCVICIVLSIGTTPRLLISHLVNFYIMNINFKYSFVNEVTEYKYLITHSQEYKQLRSVVWNPLYILLLLLFRKLYLSRAESAWKPIEPEVERAFKMLRLELPKDNLVCYVHSISCEGWYDPNKNCVHARITKCKNLGEFAGSVIHELLHLATYKNELDYNQREKIVDDYVERQPLSTIVRKIGDNPQDLS